MDLIFLKAVSAVHVMVLVNIVDFPLDAPSFYISAHSSLSGTKAEAKLQGVIKCKYCRCEIIYSFLFLFDLAYAAKNTLYISRIEVVPGNL